MSGFKLLSIRPLVGCEEKFTRILTPGTIYKFYSEYEFVLENPDDKDSDVIDVKSNEDIRLYDIGNFPINISAIVGKNGSGKSSLMELLFAAIFVASVNDEVLKPNKNTLQKDWGKLKSRRIKNQKKKDSLESQIKDVKKEMNGLKALHSDDIFNFLKKEFNKIQIEIENIEDEENSIDNDELNIDFFLHEINRLEVDVKVEIYYELDGSIYRLKIDYPQKGKLQKDQLATQHELIVGSPRNQNLWKLLNEENKIDFSHFFYSIAISYSHYGLNSNVIGDWINSLFHKNDGYQTPLVINPMRTEGNIEINTENELVKQRLLLNVLEDIGTLAPNESLRNLAPDKTAFALELKYDEEKIFSYNERIVKTKKVYPSNAFLNDLCQEYVGDNRGSDHGDQIVEGLKIYIGHKLIRICEHYDRYKKFIVKGKFTNDPKLIAMICSDKSHITFKLKQALNFLILGHFPISDRKKILQEDLDSFAKYIEAGKIRAKEFNKFPNSIELLPPSIFKQTIKLTDGTDLDDLSSGEKQLIHSISSIVYHIINVNSVGNNGEDKYSLEIKNTQSYNYINILFDEVEQYFHPELQREFLNTLLNYISKMNKSHFDNIQGLNILLATHSPFILSDIPKQNILRLEDGEPRIEKNQTFGANFYQLLANDFFLENGFIGEFSKNKINEVVDFLRLIKWEYNMSLIGKRVESEEDDQIKKDLNIQLKIIELEKSRITTLNESLTIEKCKEIIDLVGEPILEESLNNLYQEVLIINEEKR